jgi:hypothetical protein
MCDDSVMFAENDVLRVLIAFCNTAPSHCRLLRPSLNAYQLLIQEMKSCLTPRGLITSD